MGPWYLEDEEAVRHNIGIWRREQLQERQQPYPAEELLWVIGI
jgi:hypothetical protein